MAKKEKTCKECGATSGCRHEELKKAYRLVIADLEKTTCCKDKDYAIGCFSCGVRLVMKTLTSLYGFEFGSLPKNIKR